MRYQGQRLLITELLLATGGSIEFSASGPGLTCYCVSNEYQAANYKNED